MTNTDFAQYAAFGARPARLPLSIPPAVFLDHAYAARERALRHALRYRGYSRADADALREYRDCARANARRVTELEAAIREALRRWRGGLGDHMAPLEEVTR